MVLPPPPIAKDASKASKRVHADFFEPLTPETLTDWLNFPDLKVSHYYLESEGQTNYLHLRCEHKYEIAMCPRCLQPEPCNHESKSRSVRHLDILGMRTIIHFQQRRCDCEVCGRPFTEQLSWLDPKRRQTQAYEEYIYQPVKNRPRASISPWPKG